MNSPLRVWRGLTVAACVLSIGSARAADARRPMGLVIVCDGLRADAVYNGGMTNLQRLANGTWQEGYRGAWSMCAKPIDDARPYSFPNHAAIISGVTAAKHGVYFNHDTAKCRAKEWPCWLSRLMDARPNVRTEYTYACGQSNWDLCQDERVVHRDFDTNDWAHAAYKVARYQSAEAPDAAIVFLEEPDMSGHRYGFYPSSAGYLAAAHLCDEVIGQILSAIATRPTFAEEDWLIAITSDHGGYARMHGWLETHSLTTPIILGGRQVVQGEMPGFPRGQDIPATMLAHFGVSTKGMFLDSVVLGCEPAVVSSSTTLSENLLWYFSFDEKDRHPTDWKGRGCTLFGDENSFYRINGFLGDGARHVIGNEGVPCGFKIDNSAAFISCCRPELTVSAWLHLGFDASEEACVILGNKDYTRVGSPGFVLTLGERIDARTEKGVTLRFGTPTGKDGAIGTMAIERDTWGFYAVTFTREGQAWLYQGRSDGTFCWVCNHAETALLTSGLPISIGNDGTGNYRWNYRHEIDDLAVWSRALSFRELQAIHARGRAGQALGGLLK